MKQNVLLIGSGGRIQNNFIPAIRFLSGTFNIQGVYSRSAEKREAVGTRWKIPVVSDLQAFDFSEIQVVVISVTTSAVPGILKTLQPHASKLMLVIDTPVFDRLKHFKHMGLLRKFRLVRVAEDFMNFPQFELMRKVCNADLVGKIGTVNLIHTGYLHHATALIRSFYGFAQVTSSKKIKQGSNTSVNLSHGKGRRGIIVEPYKRLDGKIEIIGTKGVITTDDNDQKTHGLPCFVVKPVMKEGLLQGYEIKSATFQDRYLPNSLTFLRNFDLDDKDDFNLLKTCGLIRIFESINNTNLNTAYDFIQGSYDSIVGRMTNRLPIWLDPFGKVMKLVLSVLARR